MIQELLYIFQERQNVLEHIKTSNRILQEYFQEEEIPLEQIKFFRRAFSKYFKNIYDFPGNHTPKNRYFVRLPRWMISDINSFT